MFSEAHLKTRLGQYGAASVVGFFSALAGLWPIIRRVLGPEPATDPGEAA